MKNYKGFLLLGVVLPLYFNVAVAASEVLYENPFLANNNMEKNISDKSNNSNNGSEYIYKSNPKNNPLNINKKNLKDSNPKETSEFSEEIKKIIDKKLNEFRGYFSKDIIDSVDKKNQDLKEKITKELEKNNTFVSKKPIVLKKEIPPEFSVIKVYAMTSDSAYVVFFTNSKNTDTKNELSLVLKDKESFVYNKINYKASIDNGVFSVKQANKNKIFSGKVEEFE